jgi:2,3,4,5-tetrahydropyridine-2-carboxylate N-succinyltransferase
MIEDNAMTELQAVVEDAWERRGDLAPDRVSTDLKNAVEECLDGLESGRFRVAEPLGPPGEWKVNQWLKKQAPPALGQRTR